MNNSRKIFSHNLVSAIMDPVMKCPQLSTVEIPIQCHRYSEQTTLHVDQTNMRPIQLPLFHNS